MKARTWIKSNHLLARYVIYPRFTLEILYIVILVGVEKTKINIIQFLLKINIAYNYLKNNM